MAIVIGQDMARENFSKTFVDINVGAATIESGQPSMTIKSVPSKVESGTSSDSRSHRKRSRNDEEGCDMGNFSNLLQEVVSALKQISNNQLDVGKLYEEIMKMDDIEEMVRVAAFGHLVEHEMLAKAFFTKSTHLRKLWFAKIVKSLPSINQSEPQSHNRGRLHESK
ncbi:Cytidylate kinase [Bienertia sinuspersici]